jgi:calcium binding protein 39
LHRIETSAQFFSTFALLIQSSNYVTKRQSLKLLSELLLDRSNYAVMNKYIAIDDNLKMIMNMLRDKSKNIQFEAFHVFKVSCQPLLSAQRCHCAQVFVANPKKPPNIEAILRRNKDKLVSFLQGFHNDRDGAASKLHWNCVRDR